MAKSTFSSAVAHTDDTTFRAWGLEFSDALTAVGFIKSTDTGQIDWTTATRPSANVAAGYEIRYLNDSLHATAPIYMKLEYGTSTAGADIPGIWVTVGTGSDGSGALTGVFIAREGSAGTTAPVGVTAWPSYFCMVEGCVWAAFKTTSRNTDYPTFGFILERTCDDAGAPTATGVTYYRLTSGLANYAGNCTTYTFATGYTKSNVNSAQDYGGGGSGYAFMPYGLLGVATVVAGVPGDFQVARHYHPTPEVRPQAHLVSASTADGMAIGTDFDCTPVGVTPRTFICLGRTFSYYDFFCPIWE